MRKTFHILVLYVGKERVECQLTQEGEPAERGYLDLDDFPDVPAPGETYLWTLESKIVRDTNRGLK